MTGEMHSIDQDGNDSNGESWPVHAAVAKAVGGVLRPFDKYQGPYIAIGIKRLWLCTEDGYSGTIYREDTETESEPFPVEDAALAAAIATELVK